LHESGICPPPSVCGNCPAQITGGFGCYTVDLPPQVPPDITRYLEDASGYRGHADAVRIPGTEEELAGILREAFAERIPITVAGAGTGLAGGRVPHGGWVLSLEKFRRLEISRGKAITGAGVTLTELQAAAAATAQFFPPDPTEYSASVGGAIAANASGSRSFLYGDTRRHVFGVRVALMGGSVLDLPRGVPIDFEVPALPLPQSTKHSAGYRLAPGMDWVDLFAGSEGTLGIVTEATLNLLPLPIQVLAGVVFFRGDESALAAVEGWRSVPGLRMLEYMDAGSLRLLRSRFPEIPGGAAAALLIEQELSPEPIAQDDELDAWLDRLAQSDAFAAESWFGIEDRDRERFRRFRHALPEAVNQTVRQRGFLKLGSDYAVPLRQNGAMLAFYREVLSQEWPGEYVIFGHIGDAHVHLNLLPGSAEEFVKGQRLMLEFAREAVRLGGTVGAEHGLGKRKAHLLAIQYQKADIDAMKAVKQRLDPLWLLGQGTLFPMP
jgi:FAD/FMN-containing dehydrogenase